MRQSKQLRLLQLLGKNGEMRKRKGISKNLRWNRRDS